MIFVPRKFGQTSLENGNSGSLAHTDSLHQLAETGISVSASDSESAGLTPAAFRSNGTAGYMDVQGRSWIVLDLAEPEIRASESSGATGRHSNGPDRWSGHGPRMGAKSGAFRVCRE